MARTEVRTILEESCPVRSADDLWDIDRGYPRVMSLFAKHAAAWAALLTCLALVLVTWQSDSLPSWLMAVGGVGALGALRAIVATKLETRCPKRHAHAGRPVTVHMWSGKRMNVPSGEDNPTRGRSESTYRCGECQNEWQEHREWRT